VSRGGEPRPLHRTGRLWLLGALLVVVAPQLWRLPLWLALLSGGLIAWRLARDHYGWPLPSRWLRLPLVVAGAAGILLEYRTFSGLEAGPALLTLMLSLKLLELRRYRDALVVVYIGYFLVAASFFHDQSLLAGAYLLAAVFALTTALVVLHHPGGTASDSRRHLRTTGGLLLQAVPIMLVLFLLFPRLPTPLWGIPQPEGRGITGLSDTMRPGAITHLAESDAVAFRVRFPQGIPPADRLYWRGPVLWHTDGRTWRPRQLEERLGREAAYEAGSPAVEYTLTLEPHDRRWLFALDLPTAAPPGGRLTADYQLLAEEPVEERIRYRQRSHLDYRTPPLTPPHRRAALQLPEDAHPKARQLAAAWRESGLEGEALVKQALQHFADTPFFYTRRPPALTGDPVDQFLFESRRGFCEHYAAAFVVLMRAAGLPARVVTGYQGGEYNPMGEYLVVRQSQAHAWAEVHLGKAGWRRFDPTAAIPPERVEMAPDLQRFRSTEALLPESRQLAWLAARWRAVRQGWDNLNHSWNQWVLGYDRQQQMRLLERLGMAEHGWQALVVLLAQLLALLLTVVALWLLRRRPALRPDPALRLYQRFCSKVARRGLVRGPSEGPQEFAHRVAASQPELARQTARITALYIRLRYGGEAGDRELLSRLHAAIKRL